MCLAAPSWQAGSGTKEPEGTGSKRTHVVPIPIFVGGGLETQTPAKI